MNLTRGFLIFLALALLGGCATMPTGPTVTVYPALESLLRYSRLMIMRAGNGRSSR